MFVNRVISGRQLYHGSVNFFKASTSSFNSENIFLVRHVCLFKEDESEDSVGAQSEVVGGEPFPQGEESLVFDHLSKDVSSSLVFRDTVHIFHRLQSSFHDINRH